MNRLLVTWLVCSGRELGPVLEQMGQCFSINPLNAELNPICRLLALFRAHHILRVCRLRVKCTAFSSKQENSVLQWAHELHSASATAENWY